MVRRHLGKITLYDITIEFPNYLCVWLWLVHVLDRSFGNQTSYSSHNNDTQEEADRIDGMLLQRELNKGQVPAFNNKDNGWQQTVFLRLDLI